MRSYDQAFLLLLAIALSAGVAVFRRRRRRGSSRGIATFAAGCTIGAVIAVAFLLQYDLFMPPRASIGLERIVGPIVTMFASLIVSGILGGIVSVVDSRRNNDVASTDGAEAILQQAAQRTGASSASSGDWRAAARRAAGATRDGGL